MPCVAVSRPPSPSPSLRCIQPPRSHRRKAGPDARYSVEPDPSPARLPPPPLRFADDKALPQRADAFLFRVFPGFRFYRMIHGFGLGGWGLISPPGFYVIEMYEPW